MVESLLHDVIMICGVGLLIISYQQWQEFGGTKSVNSSCQDDRI